MGRYINSSKSNSSTKITTPTKITAPQQSDKGFISNICSTIVSGMAFGTGNAIAHRAIGSILDSGKSAVPIETVTSPTPINGPCNNEYKQFMSCMQENPNDIRSCDYYLQNLQACKSLIPI